MEENKKILQISQESNWELHLPRGTELKHPWQTATTAVMGLKWGCEILLAWDFFAYLTNLDFEYCQAQN